MRHLAKGFHGRLTVLADEVWLDPPRTRSAPLSG